MMKKRLINIFICCIISYASFAQVEGYKFYALLDTVKKSGFYNIALAPAINANLKTDYSDVRIVNAANKWVPHILHTPKYAYGDILIKADLKYTITENNKSNTNILISSAKVDRNNIGLIMNNTSAERYCKLSGSDDNKNWFVINDSILIDPESNEENSETDFRIDFPKCNYLFYKISIINNNKDPFKIKAVVYNTTGTAVSKIKINETKNLNTVVFQKDTAKISYIKVTQQKAFHFDALNLKLNGSTYFSRKVELYVPDKGIANSFANMGELVKSFTVSNNSALKTDFLVQASKVFYLLIYNDDNLPLTVNTVSTIISEHYITSYLEKGQVYKLILGNEMATLPNYDLEETFPTMKDTLPLLAAKEIIAFKENIVAPNDLPKNNNKWIIWTALITGLFILLFLTIKMMKEVNKKTNNDTI